MYNEYVKPYYPETSFKEFAGHFMQKFEKDKSLGYTGDSLTWLNAWFQAEGENFKRAAEKQRGTVGEENVVEQPTQEVVNNTNVSAPPVSNTAKPIWGMKPVYFYAGATVVSVVTLAVLVKWYKNLK